MAEQFGFDHVLRHRRKLHRAEAVRIRLRETARLPVERDVLRERDGAGHQLLSGTAFACDQSGYIVHTVEQQTVVAIDVIGEDGLPDIRPHLRRLQRAARDEIEYMVERAMDLENHRKRLFRREFARLAAGRTQDRGFKILQKRLVAFVMRLLRLCLHELANSHAMLLEQPVQDHFVIDAHILLRRRLLQRLQPRQELFHKFVADFEDRADVAVHQPFTVLIMPHGIGAGSIWPQNGAFLLQPLRREGVRVVQAADGLRQAAFFLVE